MKKLTRKIVALTLSLVMCISFSNTTFAYADNENISSSAEASKVNWWKIGWIILSDYVVLSVCMDIGLSLSIFLHRLHSSCQMPLVIR